MSRSIRAVLPAALLLATALAPATAVAHEGNPNYRSTVRAIVPATDGLTAQVLDHDDALLLVNRSGKAVVVLAEGGVPAARLLADGTVQVNERAPALEEEEGEEHEDEAAADGVLLASLDGAQLAHGDEEHEDEPGEDQSGRGGDDEADGRGIRWTTLDRTGRYQFHDARIKYRASAVPPQVTDETKETKVKDWRVPLLVAGQPAAIEGTLTWVGEPDAGSSFPTAAVVSLVVIALGAIGIVVAVRRNRREATGGEPS